MNEPREIPTVADYDHHGEDARAVWWEENRYDMEVEPDPYDHYDDIDY